LIRANTEWDEGYLQLLGCHDLLDVFGITIEHKNQSFVIEVADLSIEMCDIVNPVALWKVVARNHGSSRFVVPQGILLSCEWPEEISMGSA
jgi:hypothetical protein